MNTNRFVETIGEYYETSDLGLAAFLSLDRPLVGVVKDGPSRVRFRFLDDPRLRSDVDDYFGLRGSVQPLRYNLALRGLKSVVHEVLRGNSVGSMAQSVLPGKRAV